MYGVVTWETSGEMCMTSNFFLFEEFKVSSDMADPSALPLERDSNSTYKSFVAALCNWALAKRVVARKVHLVRFVNLFYKERDE